MRKFKSDRCWEHEDGEFVLDIDAEAAIEQAKKDERAKCVAEINSKAKDLEVQGWKFYGKEFRLLAKELAKGLNQ